MPFFSSAVSVDLFCVGILVTGQLGWSQQPEAPAETQNGNVFRLGGRGMPQLGGSSRGDLFARASVVLPDKLTAREKELFEELNELRAG